MTNIKLTVKSGMYSKHCTMFGDKLTEPEIVIVVWKPFGNLVVNGFIV